MKKLREYMTAIEGNHEKENEIHEILGWGLHKLKMHDEDDYDKMMLKIHCVVYGCHFDDELAHKAVAHMKNVDGSEGQHWSKADTDRLADQYGIHYKCDWYYAINMLWSDLANVMGSDANTYAKMAKAMYFDDPDMPEGKLFHQYIAMH